MKDLPSIPAYPGKQGLPTLPRHALTGLLMGLLCLPACSVVTINPVGTDKLRTEPDFRDHKPFYFWGLKGEHDIDVTPICPDTEVIQMQTSYSFSDILLGTATFGIYAPLTVKVWCSES